MRPNQKLAVYKQVDVRSRIEGASPHRLIQMLYEGALDSLAAAKGAIEREDIATKGAVITRAINIISGLRDSLDSKVNSDLPYNLDRLYDYMQRRLLQANSENDLQIIEEVVELLQTLKSGWDQMTLA